MRRLAAIWSEGGTAAAPEPVIPGADSANWGETGLAE